VYKFITEDTIEVRLASPQFSCIFIDSPVRHFQEEIYTLGETKLQLDNAVGGIGTAVDADGKTDQSAANDTKKSLMKTIRQRVVGITTQANGTAAATDKIEDVNMEDVKVEG